jgi:DNA transposition AAA+ family ATPase
MTQSPSPVNTIAPLRNVALLSQLVERVQNRTGGLPGMATFHGPSGYGKTFAAIYAANKYRAYHVQVKSVWTRKKFCAAVLHEMGIQAAPTIADMLDQIGQELSLSRRPLLIDEADFLVSKGMIEVIRDIYESSQGAIVLIGEETLPNSLKRWERVHGRMLDWAAAQPGNLGDAKHLAKLYCRDIEIADDLLVALHEASAGSVRRICVNLDRVRERAETTGLRKIDLTGYGADFFTGNPPARRV